MNLPLVDLSQRRPQAEAELKACFPAIGHAAADRADQRAPGAEQA